VGELVPISKEKLTPAEYNALADVPPELEWLANITTPKHAAPTRSMSRNL